MITERFHVSLPVSRYYLVMGGLILAAWGFLVAWQRSAYAELLSHEALAEGGFLSMWHLAAFLLGWFLMTVAMMLPGSLPLLRDYVYPVRRPVERSRSAALIILGYLSPWALFGLLAYLGDSVLHHMMESSASLAAYAGLITPAIVLAAGLYQFTPVKHSSMLRCRPGHSLFLKRCVEKLGGVWAWKQGLRLGVYCVASCWSLMLLMFALRHDRLDWMLALSGIMAVERLVPWGRRLSWLVGFVLIVWAAFWVLAAPHSGHNHP